VTVLPALADAMEERASSPPVLDSMPAVSELTDR
jgi:hypothetical protein